VDAFGSTTYRTEHSSALIGYPLNRGIEQSEGSSLCTTRLMSNSLISGECMWVEGCLPVPYSHDCFQMPVVVSGVYT
jgi:hypothetical protein